MSPRVGRLARLAGIGVGFRRQRTVGVPDGFTLAVQLLVSIAPLELDEAETGDPAATATAGWTIVLLAATTLGALVAAVWLGAIVSRRRA